MEFPSEEAILSGQLEYYRWRAAEYDEWWLRTGRFDHGPVQNDQWRKDISQVESALTAFRPAGRVLELACGTGIWSARLCAFADKLTAIDGSAEMLAINQARLNSKKVEYIQADLFQSRPFGLFDVIFFGFWLSHVPPSRFAAFWEMVAACLTPSGRVFFVDSRHNPSSTAVDHRLPGEGAITMRRRLNDGREFEIYKLYYERGALATRLHQMGWSFSIEESPRYFIYGSGKRDAAP